MADQAIQPADDERKALVREQLANAKVSLAPIEVPAGLVRAKKVPLGQIAAIGTAFASMPEVFRTVTQTVTTPGSGTLMQALGEAGNVLDISQLQKFKDGSGALGSILKDGSFEQVRLVQAAPQTLTTTTTIPYNPTMIAMAIALQQINQKLDAIQKTLDEMFDYMRQRDKAEMRGNLQTLADVLDGYRLNWDNPRYMDNAHMKVLDIKQDATQKMEFYSGQVAKALAGKRLVKTRGTVEKRLDKVLDSLKDYQLATYIYAFASFLDPMLCENFKAERLSDVADRIEEASIRYRDTYTRAYEALEGATKGSVDAHVLSGLAAAGRFLDEKVRGTPIREYTIIGEVFEGGGKLADKFNQDENSRLLEKLHAAKSLDVQPFLENVRSIDALYNQPSRLLTDGESLYILPTSPQDETE